ncbi:MAG: hypothetical protein MR016_04740 [Agathobacter sp.]|nr:hypothetical protein [Agathobacter sp.]
MLKEVPFEALCEALRNEITTTGVIGNDHLADPDSICPSKNIEMHTEENKITFLLLPQMQSLYLQLADQIRIYSGQPGERPFLNMENVIRIDQPQMDVEYDLAAMYGVDHPLLRKKSIFSLYNSVQMPKYYEAIKGSKIIFDIAKDNMIRMSCINSYADEIAFVPSTNFDGKLDLINIDNPRAVKEALIHIETVNDGNWFHHEQLSELLKQQGLLLIIDSGKPDFVYHCEFCFDHIDLSNEIYYDAQCLLGSDVAEMNLDYLSPSCTD